MYLLDTNVVSELRKLRAGKGELRVEHWIRRVPSEAMYVSVVTIEELEIGVLRMERRDSLQGALLRTWLNRGVVSTFAGRILAIDIAVAQRSARLQVPDPRPIRDTFLAATALVHGMTVVTRNVGDFESTGVAVLNPWLA